MSAQPVEEDGCRACSAPTDLYLCGRCVGTLRSMLTALYRGERDTPGLLEHLGEAAIGQVRMDLGGGRRTRKSGLIQYTDPKPASDGLGGTEGQRRLEQDAEDGKLSLNAVLRQGGLNPKAVRLLEETHRFLVSCVETLAAYGVTPPAHFAAVPQNSIPASFRLAQWLSGQMAAIPVMDQAGHFYDRLDNLIRRIEKTIDRPEPLRTCGPCPTVVESRQECATALEAKHDQREVTCPRCKQTHNVDELITRTYNAAHYMNFTIRELVDWVLPRLEEPVPERTLYGWIKRDALKIRGYNGNGDAMLLLADVLAIRRSKPRHAAS